MRALLPVALWGGLAITAAGQTDPGRLARIREQMARNLTQVPNYTCLETIERSQRSSPKHKFQTADKVRLEVALVDGDELFSWPGAGRFEERNIDRFVDGGTTSRGDYALHARAIFASTAPAFRFAGDEVVEGRPAVRFDYDVELARSDYHVRSGDSQAAVPYHGSFWADRVTLELIRLDIVVDVIPAELEIARAFTEINYGKVRVGQSDFLLPRRVELVLRRADGSERRNQTDFAGCHQYVGESVILFDDPVTAGDSPGVSQIELPAGLSLDLRLSEPVDLRVAVVGDPVTATLKSAAKKDGKIAVPKGAVFRGRIRRLVKERDYMAVAIELFEARFENSKAPMFGRLEQVGPLQGASSRALLLIPEEKATGMGGFMIQTARFPTLPAGFRMVWVSLAAPR